MSYHCTKCNKQREQGCFGPRCPGIPKHANNDDLPALPPPDRTMWQHGRQIDHYTADQMRAYANAALGALADAADTEILRMVALGLGQRPSNAENEYEPTPMEPFQAGLL